jgi:hypothetical protein
MLADMCESNMDMIVRLIDPINKMNPKLFIDFETALKMDYEHFLTDEVTFNELSQVLKDILEQLGMVDSHIEIYQGTLKELFHRIEGLYDLNEQTRKLMEEDIRQSIK